MFPEKEKNSQPSGCFSISVIPLPLLNWVSPCLINCIEYRAKIVSLKNEKYQKSNLKEDTTFCIF